MSIQNFDFVNISDEVLGAAVGAFLGALGAFLIGLLVERRAAKRARDEKNFDKASESMRNLSLAEVSCQEISILLVDGIKLLRKIPSSIESDTWLVTLPRRLKPSEVSILGLRNYQLVNEWTALKFKLDLTNHLLDEFINYYSKLSAIYEQRAIDSKLNPKDITEMHQTAIKEYSAKLQDQMANTLDDVAEMYALIRSHAEARGAQVFNAKAPQELHTFTVEPAHKAKHLKLIRLGINKML